MIFKKKINLRKLGHKWNDYWFHKDSHISLGICRIALGVSLLWAYFTYRQSDYKEYLLIFGNEDTYVPTGLLSFLGNSIPSPIFLEICSIIAFLATIFVIIWFLTRFSLITALLSNLIIYLITESFDGPSWSHGYNVVFLATIAFLFSESHQSFSIDKYLADLKFNTGVNKNISNYSFWSINLTQWSIALMFPCAAFWKFTLSGVEWFASDNMRNILLLQYSSFGLEMPSWLQIIADNEFLFKSLAFGAFLAQLMPLFACFSLRKPILRAFFGLFFVFETIGLGLVMSLWWLYWLPLYAFFIDWEYLSNRLSVNFNSSTNNFLNRVYFVRNNRYIYVANSYVLAFITFYLTMAILTLPGTDSRLNTYPFSGFPMYSSIYDKEMFNISFEINDCDTCVDITKTEEKLMNTYYKLLGKRDFKSIKATLLSMVEFMKIKEKSSRFQISIRYKIFHASEYPEEAKLKVVSQGLLGRINQDGIATLAFINQGIDRAKKQKFVEVEQIGLSNFPHRDFKFMGVSRDGGFRTLPIMSQEGNKYFYSSTQDIYAIALEVFEPISKEKLVFFSRKIFSRKDDYGVNKYVQALLRASSYCIIYIACCLLVVHRSRT